MKQPLTYSLLGCLTLAILLGCRSTNPADNWFKPQGGGNFGNPSAPGAQGNFGGWGGNPAAVNGLGQPNQPSTNIPGGNPALYNGSNWQPPYVTPGINPASPQPGLNSSGFNSAGTSSTNAPLQNFFQSMSQWWKSPQSNYNPSLGSNGNSNLGRPASFGQPAATSAWNSQASTLPFPVPASENRWAQAPTAAGNVPSSNFGPSINPTGFGGNLPATGAVIRREGNLGTYRNSLAASNSGREAAPRIVEPTTSPTESRQS